MLTPRLPKIKPSGLLEDFAKLSTQAQRALQGQPDVDTSAVELQVPRLPRLDPGLERPTFNARRARLNRNLALVGALGSLIGSLAGDQVTTRGSAGLATGAAEANRLGSADFQERLRAFEAVRRQSSQFNTGQATREAEMDFDLLKQQRGSALVAERQQADDERASKKQADLQARIGEREKALETMRQEGRATLEDQNTRNALKEIHERQAAIGAREISVARTKKAEGLSSSSSSSKDFDALSPEELDAEISTLQETLKSGKITEFKAGQDTKGRFDRTFERPLKASERTGMVKQLAAMKAAKKRAATEPATGATEAEVKTLIKDDLADAIESGQADLVMRAAEQAHQLGAIDDNQLARIRASFGM